MNIAEIKREYDFYQPYYEALQNRVVEIIEIIKNQKVKPERGSDIAIKEIIRRLKNNNGIRIKELKSIIENFKNGRYKGKEISSIIEIPDIAGVRVVCYCKDDQKELAQILTQGIKTYDNTFKLKPNGKDEKEKPEESYKAIHVDLVKKIGMKEKGGAKGEIRLACEVQIRTILQHAWAELDEKFVPKNRRKEMGMSQTIENSVSNILAGCENLWILTKKIKK